MFCIGFLAHSLAWWLVTLALLTYMSLPHHFHARCVHQEQSPANPGLPFADPTVDKSYFNKDTLRGQLEQRGNANYHNAVDQQVAALLPPAPLPPPGRGQPRPTPIPAIREHFQALLAPNNPELDHLVVDGWPSGPSPAMQVSIPVAFIPGIPVLVDGQDVTYESYRLTAPAAAQVQVPLLAVQRVANIVRREDSELSYEQLRLKTIAAYVDIRPEHLSSIISQAVAWNSIALGREYHFQPARSSDRELRMKSLLATILLFSVTIFHALIPAAQVLFSLLTGILMPIGNAYGAATTSSDEQSLPQQVSIYSPLISNMLDVLNGASIKGYVLYQRLTNASLSIWKELQSDFSSNGLLSSVSSIVKRRFVPGLRRVTVIMLRKLSDLLGWVLKQHQEQYPAVRSLLANVSSSVNSTMSIKRLASSVHDLITSKPSWDRILAGLRSKFIEILILSKDSIQAHLPSVYGLLQKVVNTCMRQITAVSKGVSTASFSVAWNGVSYNISSPTIHAHIASLRQRAWNLTASLANSVKEFAMARA